MKKLFLIIVTIVLLAACDNAITIHDDINNEVAEDVLQLVDVVADNIKKGITYDELSDSDRDIVDGYYEKYTSDLNKKYNMFDGGDLDIILGADVIVTNYMVDAELDQENNWLEHFNNKIVRTISTGRSDD